MTLSPEESDLVRGSKSQFFLKNSGTDYIDRQLMLIGFLQVKKMQYIVIDIITRNIY